LTKICPECGNENKETSEFCESCGAFLDDMGVEKSTSGGLSWWDRQILLIRAHPAILLIPVAIILIFGALMLNGSIDDSPSTFAVGNVSMTHYSGNGFSFDFPSNWVSGDISSDYPDITFAAYDDNSMCIVFNGTVENTNNSEFKPLKEQYLSDYNTITSSYEGVQIKKEDINQSGVEGFIAVFKCNKSQLDDNKTTYTEEKFLMKGTEGRELYLVVATDYYEANKDLIDRIVNSFQID